MTEERIFNVPERRLSQEMCETICMGFAQCMPKLDNPKTFAYASHEPPYWKFVFVVPKDWAKSHEGWWGEFIQRMEHMARPPSALEEITWNSSR